MLKVTNSFNLEINKWSVVENDYQPERKKQNAVLFFVGNGNLGIPSEFNEDNSSVIYVNGFYESSKYSYPEGAYGFPENKQTMLPLPGPNTFSIKIDGEVLDLEQIKFDDYKRKLDFKDTILKRSFIWELENGKKVRVCFSHQLSFIYLNAGFSTLSVTPIDNAKIKLEVSSALAFSKEEEILEEYDPRKAEEFDHKVWNTKSSQVADQSGLFSSYTTNSDMHFATSIIHQTNIDCFKESHSDDNGLYFDYEIKTTEEIRIDKYFAYVTSIAEDKNKLEIKAHDIVTTVSDLGIEKLKYLQKGYLADFWNNSDIEIKGDLEMQQGIRYNILGLLQSSGKDGKRSIAAKGLSSDGYEGHFFWDAESYVVPHYIYTNPEIAREMLMYRYNTLDAARNRAQELSHAGALYAWRTINGEECSAYFPAGTAQYHINADIALAIKQYVEATNDLNFMDDYGKEMIYEIARFFRSLGAHVDGKGFVINGVTGPDEYTAIVNNNLYTNIMVKDVFEYAALLKDDVNDSEAKSWTRAANAMYIPYSEEKGIHKQDDTFLEKEVWDFENTPKDKYPLLLNFHPLNIYRYQVLKQPDTVLAMFFQSKHFDYADKIRNFNYYNPLCTGDSSLSSSISSIVACEINLPDEAMRYFEETARMDIDDVLGNVGNGIHTACMAGTWSAVIFGFAGFRNINGNYSFVPNLPKEWDSLSFKLNLNGCQLKVRMQKDKTVYELKKGNELSVKHYGEQIIIQKGEVIEMSTNFELKAVVFDLDGVITDTAKLHYKAWGKLAENHGYNFDESFDAKLRGVSRRTSIGLILEYNNVTNLSEDEIAVMMAEKNDFYKSMLDTITHDDILPGVANFLQSLKDNGIKLALASASANGSRILDQLGLTEMFDVIVDPTKLKKSKPDPEIFLKGAEMCGAHYKNCIGIEDAEAGVIAINAAGGMMSVGIGDSAKNAHYHLEDTSKLDLDDLKKQFEKYHS